MEKVIQVINDLVRNGIIDKYAIGGATGVIFYTETLNTKDIDVFINPKFTTSGIVHLGSIYEYLQKAGYKMEGQYFIIDGIPIDLIPVYNDLTLEALNNSAENTFNNNKVKVFRPEYLLAIALQTGRTQDLIKVELLMKEAELDKLLLEDILRRHGLYERWEKYGRG